MLKYVAKRFLRAELAKFLPNARLVAEFEKMSQDVVETIPANIEQTVQAALLSNTPAMAARVEDAETRILALESAPRPLSEDRQEVFVGTVPAISYPALAFEAATISGQTVYRMKVNA